MKRLISAAILLAAAPASHVVAQQNWDIAFEQTDKGYRVGNPEADIRLIEFVSYTCPHCANFEVQADAPLRLGFVQPGTVQVEVRHMIRNSVDLAAALATECGDPDKFFGNHRRMLRAQEEWLGKARAASDAQQQRWNNGPIGARMQAIANDLDFHELMETRGYSVNDLNACLNDEARAREMVELSNGSATEFGVRGTPSFVMNGQLLEGVHNWPALQSALETALADEEEAQ